MYATSLCAKQLFVWITIAHIVQEKHKWLVPKDYKDKDALQEVVTNILQKFGEGYKINF